MADLSAYRESVHFKLVEIIPAAGISFASKKTGARLAIIAGIMFQVNKNIYDVRSDASYSFGRSQMRGSNKYIFLISVFLLSGCGVDWFGLASQKISEDYTIGYIDDPSFRTIRYQNVGQIPPCVFEVGWSDKYIIAKQRFAKSHNEKINYYIIDIEKNKDIPGRVDQKEGVLGPFTESEFVIKSHELKLPKDLVFSKVYKGCE